MNHVNQTSEVRLKHNKYPNPQITETPVESQWDVHSSFSDEPPGLPKKLSQHGKTSNVAVEKDRFASFKQLARFHPCYFILFHVIPCYSIILQVIPFPSTLFHFQM